MILQTNYKPKAPADDKALWSRNILVPFEACFDKNPNENLKEELLEESEGILNWLIQGCLEYQEIGLDVPQSVKDQTESYRKENDGIGLFLEEACVEAPEFSTQKSYQRT